MLQCYNPETQAEFSNENCNQINLSFSYRIKGGKIQKMLENFQLLKVFICLYVIF